MSSDLDNLIKFYTEILGLSLIKNYAGHNAEVSANNINIGIHPSSAKITPGNNMSVGFGVASFDDEVRALKLKGIDVHTSIDGPIRIAKFSDPDGNPLFLAEELS